MRPVEDEFDSIRDKCSLAKGLLDALEDPHQSILQIKHKRVSPQRYDMGSTPSLYLRIVTDIE